MDVSDKICTQSTPLLAQSEKLVFSFGTLLNRPTCEVPVPLVFCTCTASTHLAWLWASSRELSTYFLFMIVPWNISWYLLRICDCFCKFVFSIVFHRVRSLQKYFIVCDVTRRSIHCSARPVRICPLVIGEGKLSVVIQQTTSTWQFIIIFI